MGKRRKRKDSGAIIFRLVGIELLILFGIMAYFGVRYVPDAISRLRGNNVQNQEAPIVQNPDVNPDNQGPGINPGDPNAAPQGNGDAVQTAADVINVPETTEEDFIGEQVISSVSLVAVGDNMMHRSNTLSGLHADGTYSYYDNFCNMQDIFKASDIAVLSQDTVMGGMEFGTTSDERFNTTFEVGTGMADAGINVVLAANNHIMDMGKDGLNNMINFWRGNYPAVTLLGVNQSQEQQNTPVYIEKNGIKIALVNYTCKTNFNDALTEEPYLLNQKDESWLTNIMNTARAEADFVIVFPHWGTQDEMEITSDQEQQARFLAGLGADLIIGNYPHVVEPVKWITAEDGKKTLVYYSLGNFQSIQNTKENMLGGLANVTITKTDRRTYLSDCKLDFVVTHYAQENTNDYFDIVTTFPWSQYSEELAAQHGIRVWDPTFTYENLDQLRKEILERCDYK